MAHSLTGPLCVAAMWSTSAIVFMVCLILSSRWPADCVIVFLALRYGFMIGELVASCFAAWPGGASLAIIVAALMMLAICCDLSRPCLPRGFCRALFLLGLVIPLRGCMALLG